MIVDAEAVANRPMLEADLCVVGAGPAGITVALQAAERGMHVILLEAGGRRPSADSQSLCAGEVVGEEVHPSADAYRRRGLGGTSVVWGGRCLPLDPCDFAPRPWLNLPSGWPISYETMLPYWRRAHGPAELGQFDYAAQSAIPGGMRPMFPGLAAATISTETIERFSRPTDFGAVNRVRLGKHPRIHVLLKAVCTNIALVPNLDSVLHIDFATGTGRRRRVRARHYVLAAGGLEVPRLLLASRAQMCVGVGNAHGMVGRHYMCHLAGVLGRFTPSDASRPWHGYEQTVEGVYCRRRISVEPWAQQAYRISNVIARLHHPSPADPSHHCGPLSALYLGRRLLPHEYTRRLRAPQGDSGMLPHIRNVLADPLATMRFAWHSFRYRYLPARKYPSITVVPRHGAFTLDVHAEQLPNPSSRVTLADAQDRFGVPRLRIDWRTRPDDYRSVRVAMGLMGEAFAAGGFGRLAFGPAEVEAGLRREGAYGGHHLGTARMSESPRTGVVNENCRVHDVDNLYITGGAVFATSGQANPTLTILALALRLGEHLGELHATGAATLALGTRKEVATAA